MPEERDLTEKLKEVEREVNSYDIEVEESDFDEDEKDEEDSNHISKEELEDHHDEFDDAFSEPVNFSEEEIDLFADEIFKRNDISNLSLKEKRDYIEKSEVLSVPVRDLDEAELEKYRVKTPKLDDLFKMGSISKSDYKKVREAAASSLYKDPSTELPDYVSSIQTVGENSTAFLREAFKKQSEGDSDFNYQNEKVIDRFTRGSKVYKEKDMDGLSALRALNSNLCGIKRVNLLNSGFFIEVIALTPGEYSKIVKLLEDIGRSHDRQLGVPFHTMTGSYIKRILLEQLYGKITNSDFSKWKNREAFFNNLSINDYDVVLWAFASEMFPNGFEISYYCPKCGARIPSKVDFRKTRMSNFKSLTPDSFEILAKKSKSEKDLREYRESLSFMTSEHSVIRNGQYEITLQVPSVSEYDEVASIFKENAIKAVYGEDVGSNELLTAFTTNQLSILSCWVSAITHYDEEGNLHFIMNKKNKKVTVAQMYDAMAILQNSLGEIKTDIEEFIKKSKISFIGFPNKPCESCGGENPYAVNEHIPYDIETAFFTMLNRLLYISALE